MVMAVVSDVCDEMKKAATMGRPQILMKALYLI
jgi:hypothetical protein